MSIGKIMGYVAKAVRKAPKTNILSKVETNTAGRILRMQDAKQAFTLGSRNYEIVHKPLQNTSGLRLVTKDAGIGEKLAKMYPQKAQSYETMTNAEKIATLQKRSDCRAAFTSGMQPQSRWSALLQKKVDDTTKLKLEKIKSWNEIELPELQNSLKKFKADFHTKFPHQDLGTNLKQIVDVKKLPKIDVDAQKIFKA